MSELAFYSTLAARDPRAEQLVPGVPSRLHKALVHVLLAVGTPSQHSMRTAFWALESDEFGETSFRRYATYHGHDQVYEEKGAPGRIGVSYQQRVTCTNEKHVFPLSTKTSIIPYLNPCWYTLPDEWAIHRNESGRCSVSEVPRRDHRNMPDFLCSLICRSDGEQQECPSCPGSHFLVHRKLPDTAHMPLCLLFDVPGVPYLLPDICFDFGGLTYELLCVVFGNGEHFNCNVRLDGGWYKYDGLGVHTEADVATRLRSVQKNVLVRLSACNSPAELSTPVTKDAGYRPVQYKYIRTSHPGELGPVRVQLPQQDWPVQFHHMVRLQDE